MALGWLKMNEWLKNLSGAVLAAALASGATMYANTQTNTTLIGRLTTSTDKLSDAVTELRITVAGQNERFVTKDALNDRLKQLKEELK